MYSLHQHNQYEHQHRNYGEQRIIRENNSKQLTLYQETETSQINCRVNMNFLITDSLYIAQMLGNKNTKMSNY